ncbi:MAG TPA: 1-(5-phosphoribosyl)-5-[(5-phosphoribosylamino)methylideneamino]imidazole-4-carboxamide isomerase [Pyrinomonadaceae bacterium]
MLIIPAIDLRGGRCVRLAQGRKTDLKAYDGDPVERARAFAAEGARMIHVVDLDGAFADAESVNREIARRIFASVGVPVQFGGGVRDEADVSRMIEWGAARVVVGTLAVESPALLAQLAGRFGERIAVGIDARGGRVVTRGWERQEQLSAVDLARRVAGAGVARIVYTDVGRDGMLTGVNVEQTCAVALAAGVPVTASGGVSSLSDLEALRRAGRECGIEGVVVGKALYEGVFTLREALAAGAAAA